MKKKHYVVIILVILVAVITVVYVNRDRIKRQFFNPTKSILQEGVQKAGSDKDVEIIANGLVVPWEIVKLPDSDYLVTERPGTLRRVGKNKQSFQIEGVQHVGEGGLMGMALHPKYDQNKYMYLYLTTKSGEALTNRIERYTFDNDTLTDKATILDKIPGAAVHDGGRIAFGPDDKLYVTTGDASNPASAQDKNSLAGKILRLNDDGTIPNDNPFQNAVYSYGHRNPQGIAWDDEGRLWSSEHGPSGTESGFDELNLIEKGGNYGWPTIRGDETAPEMMSPIAQSGSDETWAPAGLAYYDGSLFFTGLRGESLYEAEIKSDDSVELKAHLRGTYGRLRTVRTFNKTMILATSNRDGRGDVNDGDDKILDISSLFIK